MNREQIWAHLNRKYKDGKDKANLLVDAVYNKRRLISQETNDSIFGILNTPICTGVIFGQLADRDRCLHSEPRGENKSSVKEKDREIAREALSRVQEHFGVGYIDEEKFCISYVPKKALMLSMKTDGPLLERLVDAFSEKVRYNPFCKYTDLGGMKTYEWAKNDSRKRYQALIREGKEDIVRLKHNKRGRK